MNERRSRPRTEQLQRLDKLADQFERAYRAGKAPSIESYLREHPSIQRALLRRLMAVEIKLRRAKNEAVEPVEYHQRFPDDEEVIDSVLGPELDETKDAAPAERRRPAAPLCSHIGRYIVKDLLGRGGFGAVYLAEDPQLNRAVAIKVPCRERFHGDDDDVEKFLTEARTIASLRHPHIVSVHDVAIEEGLPYIVQEYINGENLANIITQEAPLPAKAAAHVLLDIAAALGYAHSCSIQHLDVKPHNILMDRSGKAVLADFGLAVSDDEKWSSGSRGTIPYMAPEQLIAAAGQYDGRTDIWSLGVVFYEMVTAHRPFDGGAGKDHKSNLVRAILEFQPKPPTQWIPTLHPLVDQICLKCLSKQIDQRYNSAAELIDDARLLTDDDLLQVDTDVGWGRRDLVMKGCLVIVVITAMVILVAFGYQPRRFFEAIDWVKDIFIRRR